MLSVPYRTRGCMVRARMRGALGEEETEETAAKRAHDECHSEAEASVRGQQELVKDLKQAGWNRVPALLFKRGLRTDGISTSVSY